MDFIGWFTIALFVLIAAGCALWERSSLRQRQDRLRAFAGTHGLTEIPKGERPAGLPPDLRRTDRMPAFRGIHGDRDLFVVPLRTRVRWGYCWALCSRSTQAHPVVALTRMTSDLWRRLGRAPRGWLRAAPASPEFAKYWVAYHPKEVSASAALPPETMRHLVDARRDLIAWIVRLDQITVLMVRENYGSRPDDWLAPALAALHHLTMP